MKNSSKVVTMMLTQKRLNLYKKGRKCLWPEIAETDLVDIILENEKYKTKL